MLFAKPICFFGPSRKKQQFISQNLFNVACERLSFWRFCKGYEGQTDDSRQGRPQLKLETFAGRLSCINIGNSRGIFVRMLKPLRLNNTRFWNIDGAAANNLWICRLSHYRDVARRRHSKIITGLLVSHANNDKYPYLFICYSFRNELVYIRSTIWGRINPPRSHSGPGDGHARIALHRSTRKPPSW
jgi:hypothetical protein